MAETANVGAAESARPTATRTDFVEVVVPLPLPTTFTYRLPPEMKGRVGVGHRVIVSFSAKKFYTAVVVGTPNLPPEGYEIKDVTMMLDEYPIVRHPQLKLWEWIADYYLCGIGDVYKAAVPAGLKIESTTMVEVNPDFPPEELAQLSEREVELLQLVDHEEKMPLSAIAGKVGVGSGSELVNHMIAEGSLIVSENLVERYRPKKEKYVAMAIERSQLPEAFEALKRKPKAQTVLLALLELTGFQRGEGYEVLRERVNERVANCSVQLRDLAKLGIVRLEDREVNRFKFTGEPTRPLPRLSEAQSRALDEIHKSWFEKDVTLLHGVTSSGKTEIYMHLINYVLQRGDQALFLVPEIALTTQLTRRLQEVFGEKVVVYHSKFSDNDRVDIWKMMLRSNEPMVVIGARSSVFLPFAKLGLVIVDEEHESSYKQYDPAPRYNGRDVAMVLARMHGAKTLLGSATPSIETYYKAQQGKFGLVTLSERFGDVKLPDIEIVDMARARAAKTLRGTFASDTERRAREAIARGNQVIFFQNRRGYAPIARCKQCAWVPRCTQCDVALTYHSSLRQLQCHYCGAVYSLPQVCPQCKEPAIEVIGYGTERVEEEVENLFSPAKIMRMDLDTTRSKHSYERIIDDFSDGKAQILVGTQMVTKGLDFGAVEMVGVLNADAIINFPDFRATERAFNMIEQVAGRAGRRSDSQGTVMIQTYQPTHHVLQSVKRHDYAGYYAREIAEREQYFYPPFSRIIYLYLKHRDRNTVATIADQYATRLRALLGNRVFGPEEPTVARIQNLYIRRIMLKIETNASIAKVKSLLRQTYLDMHAALPAMRSTQLYYDVDPH